MLIWKRRLEQTVTVLHGEVMLCEIAPRVTSTGVVYLVAINVRGQCEIHYGEKAGWQVSIHRGDSVLSIAVALKGSIFSLACDDPSGSFRIVRTERLNDAKMLAKGYRFCMTIPGVQPLYVKTIQDGIDLYPNADGVSFRRVK